LKFEEIISPVSENLNLVEVELKKMGGKLSTDHLKEIIEYFFNIKGKRLRPILALLSSGMIVNNLPKSKNDQLLQFAVGIELMHSASLIHDDVIDGDLFRRGQNTLNNIYGKKVAVLAGDVVYSLAFAALANSLPKEYEQMIVELTENMCAAEVIQAKYMTPTRELYFEIIKGKTALFMAVSCKIGAALAGATKEQLTSIEAYGLNLGLAYQIMDDCIDKDIDAKLNITIEEAKKFGNSAIASLESFEDSAYKTSLINLVTLITQRSK